MAAQFTQQVYALARMIPPGRVATYGQLAMLLGRPRAARIVGCMMSICREPDVPCHRVVKKDGALAPGDAFGAPGLQRRLLEDEGVRFTPSGCVDMRAHGWDGRGAHPTAASGGGRAGASPMSKGASGQ